MMILRLILIVMVGIAGHQAYHPTKVFGPRWGNLLRYAVGILLYIPAQIIIKAGLPSPEQKFGEVERDIIAGLLSAGALGTGTLIGHFIDQEE